MSGRGAYGRNRLSAPTTFGTRIRAIRLKWHWSQEQLAKALGCDQRTLSSWERDINQPQGPAFELLVAIFGIPAIALNEGKEFRIPDPPGLNAAEATIPYLALPPQATPGAWLVDRRDGRQAELTPRQVQATLKAARLEGRPVWIVIG